jgi:hypothetical protein
MHLPKRNILLPVSSSNQPPSTQSITDHGVTLAEQNYSSKVIGGMATEMAKQPVPVYLNLWTGKVFTSPVPLYYHLGTRDPTGWDQASPLLKKVWDKTRSLGMTVSAWGCSTTVSAADLSVVSANKVLFDGPDDVIAQITPVGCTWEVSPPGLLMPVYPGMVFIELSWTRYNAAILGVPNDSGVHRYAIRGPEGSEHGWLCEGIVLTARSNYQYPNDLFSAAATPSLLGGFRLIMDYNAGWSTLENPTWAYMATWSDTPPTSAGLQDYLTRVREDLPVYPAVGSEKQQLLKEYYLDKLPYSRDLARKIELFLLKMHGQPDAGADGDLIYLGYLLATRLHGMDPVSGNQMIPAYSRTDTVSVMPITSNALSVFLGYTNSIAGPAGGEKYLLDIIQDAYALEKPESHNVPVLSLGDNRPAPYADPYPFYSSVTKNGDELQALFNDLKSTAGFPATVTQEMIDGVASVGITALMSKKLPLSEAIFANSNFSGQKIEGQDLTAENTFIGLTENDVPVTFLEGVDTLIENGYFDDDNYSITFLPYTEDMQVTESVTVTVDDVELPVWSDPTLTPSAQRLLVITNSPLLTIATTQSFDTAYATGSFGTSSTKPQVARNMLRTAIGEEAMGATTDFYALDLSSLNAAAYRCVNPLTSDDSTYQHYQWRFPYSGSFIDMALIQRDIPKAARYVYNVLLRPLISFIDPF